MIPSTDDAIGFGEYGLVGVMIFGLLMISVVLIVALVKVVPRMIDAWSTWNEGVVETSQNNVESAKLTATGMKELGRGMEKVADSIRDMDRNHLTRHNELREMLRAQHEFAQKTGAH